MKRYFITDRNSAGGPDALLSLIHRHILAGVEMIQIREKDLSASELLAFTRRVMELRAQHMTKILVNTRADIAIAAGADGVHLPSIAPRETLPGLLVGRSCHTLDDIRQAQADFVTFSPIFESPGKGTPLGLDILREAATLGVPIYALGGITWKNAPSCIDAGAAGIAGIRLFLNR